MFPHFYIFYRHIFHIGMQIYKINPGNTTGNILNKIQDAT